MKIIIGTWGSNSALRKAFFVKSLLESGGIVVQLKAYNKKGDLVKEQLINENGKVEFFIGSPDTALLDSEIDISIHPSQQIPFLLDSQVEISAFLEREDPRDFLLSGDESADLDNLSRKLVVGTSSSRAKAFLKQYVPHCEQKEISSIVEDQIDQLISGEYDAVLAEGEGIKSMGFGKYIVRKLNPNIFTPSPGQKAVGVMCRKDFSGKKRITELLNHQPTEVSLKAERAFAQALSSGFSQPVFALATPTGQTLSMVGGVATEDGSQICRDTIDGMTSEPEKLGALLATTILKKGGSDILYGQKQKN